LEAQFSGAGRIGERDVSGISSIHIHFLLYIMKEHLNRNASSGAVYGLGFVGAAIWFISTATGFWMGVLGFLKAIVWPAFLVYQAFKELAPPA